MFNLDASNEIQSAIKALPKHLTAT